MADTASLYKTDARPEWVKIHGGVAQLGEHLPCKQGVMGSNPIISTRSAVPTADSKGSTSKGERGNTEPVNHKGA